MYPWSGVRILGPAADAARLPPLERRQLRAGADVISEALPNPQSSFHNKKQVTLLSKIDVVHSVTKRGQHR